MAIVNSRTIYTDNGLGWVDQYETLVKGYTDFKCGCGHPIKVKYRKEFKNNTLYEFRIEHRKKYKTYNSKNPNELGVFDRMMKVATYAHCDFGGRRGSKYYR